MTSSLRTPVDPGPYASPSEHGLCDRPAELLRSEPRRHYLGQVLRYALPLARWVRRLRHHHRAPAEYQERVLPEALRGMLRAAQTGTVHYADTFHRGGVQWKDLRTLEDLAHFPALSRGDVQRRFEDLLSTSLTLSHREEGIVWQTSGSTGQPVRFFVNGETNKFPFALFRFWLGRGPARPFSHGIVLLCTLPRSVLSETWLPLFGGTYFRKLHWSEPDAAAVLDRLRPMVVSGDPDSLSRLAEELQAGRAAIRPRLIVSSAFPLPAALSDSLRRLTGARVIDCYSIAETGPIAFRCASGRPFHILGAACVVETDERGEILVTNLRNPLFPLIRYRTGDLGRIAWEACECGYRGPSLVRFEGRIAARFITASGESVDPSKVEPILTRLPVRQFQLVQTGSLGMTLRYHGDADVPDAPDLRSALGRLLGGDVVLDLVREPEPLWRGGEKAVPYLCRLDTDRAGSGSSAAGP